MNIIGRERGKPDEGAPVQIPLLPEPEKAIKSAIERAISLPDPAEIRWPSEGRPHLICVDVDDIDPAIGPMKLLDVIRVRPFMAWVSNSGAGLHLIYHADRAGATGLTAEEFGALAALSILEAEPACHVELKTQTRCPRSSVLVMTQMNRAGLPFGLIAGAEVGDEELFDWLDTQGLHVGRRYDHDKCPITRGDTGGKNQPVVVMPDGIKCWKCDQFKPWVQLIRGAIPDRAVIAARNFVHWAHAALILREDYPHLFEGPGIRNDRFAALCYSALLKSIHEPDDPRVGKVFDPSVRAVRGLGTWLDPSSRFAIQDSIPSLYFRAVPYGLHAEMTLLPGETPEEPPIREWETGVNPARQAELSTGMTLPGYYPVQPVLGVRLWGRHHRRIDRNNVRPVSPPPPGKSVAKYLDDPRERLTEDDAWKVMTKSFPGLNRAYLTLLLVARGYAESGVGPVPMLLVTGPSGSAKSSTVDIAAAMLADSYLTVPSETPPDRFGLMFGQAATTGCGFIQLDEFAKLVKHDHQRVVDAFEPLYTIRRNYQCNQHYRGLTSVPVNAAVVVSSVMFPDGVYTQPQIGRRFIGVALPATCPDWQAPGRCPEGIEQWRESDPRHALAADSILSYIVDRFFPPGDLPSFPDAARSLGFELAGGPNPFDAAGGGDAIKALWEAARKPTATKPARKSLRDAGWLCVAPQDRDELAEAWREVADSDEAGTDAWYRSNLLDISDIGRSIDVPGVWVSYQRHQSSLLVKFGVGAKRGPDSRRKYNGDINAAGTEPDGDGHPGGGLDPAPDADQPRGPEASVDSGGRVPPGVPAGGRSTGGEHSVHGQSGDAARLLTGGLWSPPLPAGEGRSGDAAGGVWAFDVPLSGLVWGAGPEDGGAAESEAAPLPDAPAEPHAVGSDVPVTGRGNEEPDPDDGPVGGGVGVGGEQEDRPGQLGVGLGSASPDHVVPAGEGRDGHGHASLAGSGGEGREAGLVLDSGVAELDDAVGVDEPRARPDGPGAGVIWVDLETKSACDLKKYGGRVYSRHKTTRVICGAAIWYDELGTEQKAVWHHEEGVGLDGPGEFHPLGVLPSRVRDAIAAGRTLVAANADGFDRHIFGRSYGDNYAHLAGWRDVQHSARRLGYPAGLERLGQLLLGRGKNEEGEKLISLYCKPAKAGRKKLAPAEGADTVEPVFNRFTAITLEKMVAYCLDDVRLMKELDERFILPYERESGPTELAVVEQHRVQMERGVRFDADLARAIIEADAANQVRLRSRIGEMTGGELVERDLNSEKKVKAWLEKQGFVPRDPSTGKVSIAKKVIEPLLEGDLSEHSEGGEDDAAGGEGSAEGAVEVVAIPPVVIAVLRAKLGVSRVTSGKLESGLALANSSGRIQDTTVYYGAHTGRWTGRRVQVQNLPRGEVDEQAVEEAIAVLLGLDKSSNAE